MTIILITLLSLFTIALSAGISKVSRMAGGGTPKLPWGLDQPIYAIPFGVAGAILGSSFLSLGFWFLPSWLVGFIVAYSFAFLGKRLGHGQYFDLAETGKNANTEPESIDFILDYLFGKDPATQGKPEDSSYWRDFTGLSLTGLFGGIGIALLALFAGHFLWAFVLLLTAGAKGLMYGLTKRYPIQVKTFFIKVLKIDLEGGIVKQGHTEASEWTYGFVHGLGVASYLSFLIFTLIVG